MAASNPRIYPVVHKAMTTDKVYPGAIILGSDRPFRGIKAIASLNADATIHCQFPMPTGAIPGGTLKLITTMVTSDNGAHDAKYDVQWAAASTDSDWGGASLSAEGTQTLSISGDAGKPQEQALTLDAATLPTVGQWILMNVVLKTSGWTINQIAAFMHWLEYRA